MYNIDLIKRLNNFYIYANEGFYIDRIINKNNYVIAYSEKVTDLDCNYITNINVKDKEEFGNIQKNIEEEMNNLNRKIINVLSI